MTYELDLWRMTYECIVYYLINMCISDHDQCSESVSNESESEIRIRESESECRSLSRIKRMDVLWPMSCRRLGSSKNKSHHKQIDVKYYSCNTKTCACDRTPAITHCFLNCTEIVAICMSNSISKTRMMNNMAVDISHNVASPSFKPQS